MPALVPDAICSLVVSKKGGDNMDRLPHDPRNFRELVEADLRRPARLIIKIQDEIDPQFRIATPEVDYWIAVTLPSGD